MSMSFLVAMCVLSGVLPLILLPRPISGDNLGRVMLEKMGWKAGEGLGKSSAGITEPVCFNFLIYGTWVMGVLNMGYGTWGMEYGLWGMEHGLWGMEHGMMPTSVIQALCLSVILCHVNSGRDHFSYHSNPAVYGGNASRSYLCDPLPH